MIRYRLQKDLTKEDRLVEVLIKNEDVMPLELTDSDPHRRRSGSFADKAIWLSYPLHGYEWVIGLDELMSIIVFQRRKGIHETPKTPSDT